MYKIGGRCQGSWGRVVGAVGYVLQYSPVSWPADAQPRICHGAFLRQNRSLSKIKAAEQKEDWRASTHSDVTLE